MHHAARRFSLSSFRDSPALLRQEGGGYPVRPAHYNPLADRPDSPSPSPTLTSRRMVEPLALRTPALIHPSLARTPDTHIQDNPVLLSK